MGCHGTRLCGSGICILIQLLPLVTRFSLRNWICLCIQPLAGEGNGTPLRYSCLENPMDGGARWAAVHGVAKRLEAIMNSILLFFCSSELLLEVLTLATSSSMDRT